jgi:hypothetical protein
MVLELLVLASSTSTQAVLPVVLPVLPVVLVLVLAGTGTEPVNQYSTGDRF